MRIQLHGAPVYNISTAFYNKRSDGSFYNNIIQRTTTCHNVAYGGGGSARGRGAATPAGYHLYTFFAISRANELFNPYL